MHNRRQQRCHQQRLLYSIFDALDNTAPRNPRGGNFISIFSDNNIVPQRPKL